MSSFIIPCCGDKKLSNVDILKVRHPDGKFLLEKTLLGLKLERDDIVYVIYDKIDFEIETIIDSFRGKIKSDIVLTSSQTKTKDAAETVYKFIKDKNIKGNLIIKDINNCITYNKLPSSNFIAGVELFDYWDNHFDIRKLGFISVNDNQQVLDVIEKKIISEYVSVGFCGFEDANDFIYAYEELRNGDYPIEKLYINNIISYLIGYKNQIYHYLNVNQFEDWSSEYSWNAIQNKYADCFVDIDSFFGDMNYSFDKKLETLLELKKCGCNLIGFTTAQNIESIHFSDLKEGDCFEQIIFNCGYSKTKKMISSFDNLKELHS